ncbi:signal recognition particle-docking protein FtsY [Dickeya aquatica]|uniref:Signal recognition particle receptor FtsY n=1 Tax=Dickeya aquatica TaxID=1401087 RepID=A0A375A593_9GAMM|nr:signal recognition particle-docking protein FtsY [Dickeya aquatica]SLM61244.1 Signal recognition particle receptor protein FtsY (=alpha subunit) (TC 3.A.5.1.1) [Dickeya aquatica]
MAKEKKRGFFSWLGLGRQEEKAEEKTQEQPQAPTAQASTADEVTPVASVQPDTAALSAEPPVAVTAPQDAVAPASEPVEPTPEVQAHHTQEKAPLKSRRRNSNLKRCPSLRHQPRQMLRTPKSSRRRAWLRRCPVVDAVEVVEAALPMQEQERPTKEGFFARLKRSLVKTRQNLGSGFVGLFRGKKIDDDLFDELEEQLLIADVGVETTRKIIAQLTEHASRKQLKDAEALIALLKAEMSEILAKVDAPLDIERKTPFVILMVGVNGVGKTTTIGKLARQYQAQGKSVMLAAGDTFRAAAVEQLQVWGQRNNVPVVAQHTGADSASVIFDALQAAKARGVDVLIADTAGRLQNKSHLMEELKKIVRVMKKLDEDAPHEVMLTLDASTGQNAVSQAKLFNEAVGLSGITLTKLDGTAKGGVIFAIADQFGIPIRYIGVGEGIDDLRPFKADDFIEALFARED